MNWNYIQFHFDFESHLINEQSDLKMHFIRYNKIFEITGYFLCIKLKIWISSLILNAKTLQQKESEHKKWDKNQKGGFCFS